MPDIPSKFQKNPSITFRVILLTHKQTNKLWQKHNLLGGGNYEHHAPIFSSSVGEKFAVSVRKSQLIRALHDAADHIFCHW